jgi:hypothetical protein
MSLLKIIDMTNRVENKCRNRLERKKSNLWEVFDSACWMAKLAFLSDIFSMLKELNLSLQGWYAAYMS